MGVGTPDDILSAVERGIDMFDCVIPTRAGRTARAYTASGVHNLRNARFADDPAPLDPDCECPACTRHSRAYLHHLFRAAEMLGPMLLTWHNLTYYQSLMRGIRAAIKARRFSDHASRLRAGWSTLETPSMTDTPLRTSHSARSSRVSTCQPDDAHIGACRKPRAGKHYVVRLTCPEFTSLCPLTGQPDFAHIIIDYIPNDWIVESKSFKLLMGSYRNHGAFHEACTMEIAGKLVSCLDPVWLRIGAYWYPRGGIPIDVFWQSGIAPADVWVPTQDVPHYRGRG